MDDSIESQPLGDCFVCPPESNVTNGSDEITVASREKVPGACLDPHCSPLPGYGPACYLSWWTTEVGWAASCFTGCCARMHQQSLWSPLAAEVTTQSCGQACTLLSCWLSQYLFVCCFRLPYLPHIHGIMWVLLDLSWPHVPGGR